MVQTRAATDRALWAQRQSRLFRLPQELRDQIYYHVFSTTELVFDGRPSADRRLGKKRRAAGRMKSHVEKENISRLGLLRVCRRIRDENAERWIGQVWFSFYNLRDLQRVMTAVPPEKLSKIRFMRVLCPSTETYGNLFHCTLDTVFATLPGLRLDKLVVHGLNYHRMLNDLMQAHPADGDILEHMIARGDGWKELHYICSNSLAPACGDPKYSPWFPERGPPPQPHDWAGLLRQRDGADSHASVTIYRLDMKGERVVIPAGLAPTTQLAKSGKQSVYTGSQRRTSWLDWGWDNVFDFNRLQASDRYDWVDSSTQWCPFEGDFYRDESVEFDYTPSAQSFLRRVDEQWKGMRIVVKRGLGADYATKKRSPDIAPGTGPFPPQGWHNQQELFQQNQQRLRTQQELLQQNQQELLQQNQQRLHTQQELLQQRTAELFQQNQQRLQNMRELLQQNQQTLHNQRELLQQIQQRLQELLQQIQQTPRENRLW
ncbi:hypothetical protein CONLIGDRAFT_642300 [Coniochaeta ligniaria NRRL 30616]|uniref:DUF7730 domain-containing protein n=1 Tax=Coniochaeta ligniaria NRRL 30616 TaxID=1408157 RepID=A0A1J7JRJ8_9PEZI|nr:hypothetical protein CONLIGDRAFT_642300 [Coniochaeta ligniaria NRRL 30616]